VYLIELKAVVKALLLPPAGLLLLTLLGILMVRRWPRTGRTVALVGLAACWVAAMPVVPEAAFRWLEAGQRPLDAAAWQQARAAPGAPRAVVILGAGARRDGMVEPPAERLLTRSLERAVGGARVARDTGLPVLVSGAQIPGMRLSEAELMRRVVEGELGAPVRWLDTALPLGHAEIGRQVAAVLVPEGIDTVVLATHAYHMRRARLALESAGLRVVPAPHTFRAAPVARSWRQWVPSADGLEASFIAFHEVFGLLSYRLPGRTLDGSAPPATR
jgi:uncharacterized SAM-binding protein YcdF (DUF218 family)